MVKAKTYFHVFCIIFMQARDNRTARGSQVSYVVKNIFELRIKHNTSSEIDSHLSLSISDPLVSKARPDIRSL